MTKRLNEQRTFFNWQVGADIWLRYSRMYNNESECHMSQHTKSLPFLLLALNSFNSPPYIPYSNFYAYNERGLGTPNRYWFQEAGCQGYEEGFGLEWYVVCFRDWWCLYLQAFLTIAVRLFVRCIYMIVEWPAFLGPPVRCSGSDG